MIYATYSAVIFLLILCSAFFSLAEMSFLLASPVTLRHWAEDEGNRAAEVALGLLNETNRVVTTINIGDTIVNLAAIMLGTVFFISYYSEHGMVIGVITLFLAILVIGEILPRMIAQRYENRVFCRVARPLKVLVTLFRPLTFIFGSGQVILERASREDDEDEYFEEELLSMVDEAESGGELEARESDLIRSAINFEELLVKDILQPRVRVVAIDDEMDVREVLDVFEETGYSRLPVYHDSIDNIIGILHLKDVFNAMLDGELRGYVPLVQDVEFVFTQTKASHLLLSLQKNQSHMAIVVDEYGGTAGIVTLEDIIEELVGDIWDEHDEVDEPPVRTIGQSLYLVDANMDIDDFFEFFGLDFDDYEDDIEASSLGGWVVDLLDHLASPGEEVRFGPFVITVEEVVKRHIEKVRVAVDQDMLRQEKEA